VVNTLYETGLNAQFIAGHFFNWEFINWGVAKYCKYPWAGVYMPLSNKIFDRIMYKLRSRYNTILIPATQFKTNFDHYVKDRYALGLAADQNPSSCDNAYWINFFGRLTPFIKGPEKGAKTKNTAVVFGHFYAVKRGHYHTEFEILTTKPSLFADGELTRLFVQKMEEAINKVPHNYLWSHRRWKYSYNDEKHAHLCVRS
jgi:KDO2-lipid IV(A) lauroyltransferase